MAGLPICVQPACMFGLIWVLLRGGARAGLCKAGRPIGLAEMIRAQMTRATTRAPMARQSV